MNDESNAIQGTTRRDAMKKIGVGAAIVWSAPAIVTASSGAAMASGVEGACVNGGVPCQPAYECGDPASTCNCWVRSDGAGNWCGPISSCTDYQFCDPNGACPAGMVCVENCCGLLCYPACDAASPAVSPADVQANPAAYGVAHAPQ